MTRASSVVMLIIALLAAPLAAHAQASGRVPRVGFIGILWASSPVQAFEQGLKELGYEDGRNIILEWRWTEGDSERLPALAAELVRLNVDVIVAPGEAQVNAVRQTTSTIPILGSPRRHRPASVVYVAPMADAKDEHDELLIADHVDDPVVPHTDAVRALQGRQPDDSRRAGIPGQRRELRPDPLAGLRVEGVEGLHHPVHQHDLIGRHRPVSAARPS
jgi:hypothetical protein